jgi:hypothetical protein
MAHLVENQIVERANAVMLSFLWSALAACVVGALVFDMTYWFAR